MYIHIVDYSFILEFYNISYQLSMQVQKKLSVIYSYKSVLTFYYFLEIYLNLKFLNLVFLKQVFFLTLNITNIFSSLTNSKVSHRNIDFK